MIGLRNGDRTQNIWAEAEVEVEEEVEVEAEVEE